MLFPYLECISLSNSIVLHMRCWFSVQHQQERNSANLAEECIKSDVYPKPPPVPVRHAGQERPLPPLPGDTSAPTPAPAEGRRRPAIPTPAEKKRPQLPSRIPAVQPHIASKSKSEESLDTAR